MANAAEKYLIQGDAFMREAKYHQAEVCYDQAIADGMRTAEVYNNRGGARYGQGKYKDAISDYAQAIQLFPKIDYAHFNRANCKMETGDIAGALRDYDRAISYNPLHAESFLNRGMAHRLLKFQEAAIKDFTFSLKLDPKLLKAFEWRATTLSEMNRWEEALNDFEQYLQIKANEAHIWLKKGKIFLHLEKLELAIEAFKNALAHQALFPEAELELASTLAQTGQHKEAISLYQKILKTEASPNESEVYVRLGKSLLATGVISEAKTAFQEAHNLKPNATACLELGKIYLDQHLYTQAVTYFDQAMEQDKEMVDIYLWRGQAKYKAGNYFGAIKDTELFQSRNPREPESWIIQGFSLNELNRFEQAVRAFRKAIQLKPENPDCHLGLGISLAGQSRYNEAKASFSEALRLAPDFKAAFFNRSLCALGLTEFESAAEDLQEVIKIDPYDGRAHAQLGICAHKMGDISQACIYWRKALQLGYHPASEWLNNHCQTPSTY